MQAYDKVMAARAIGRPTASAYIAALFDDFMELHGDRLYADDAAVIGGIGLLDGNAVTVIATEKGKDTEEKVLRNFGATHPEGYRKALRLMKQADKFHRPIVCIIDTSGAYCGIGAEERGQGSAIAQNLVEMMNLRVPVISIVIGEGGSGGALALGVANEVWMLENAIYSVITPEGAASIIYKDAAEAPRASEELKLTAQDLYKLDVVEQIFNEHEGSFEHAYEEIKQELKRSLKRYSKKDGESLALQRYNRFRKMGSV